MAVYIAGRQVKVGDSLYLASYRCFGEVIGFDGASAKVQVSNTPNQKRVIFVTTGGNVAGRRQAWWHVPLELDKPFRDITAFQDVVDVLAAKGLGE